MSDGQPVIMTRDEEIATVRNAFAQLITLLARHKPEDRSALDRLWAIVKTDVEKSSAVFDAWFVGIKES